MKSCITMIGVLLLVVAARAQSLDVSYQQKHTTVQLRPMPHRDVSAKGHDGLVHTFSCVPINDLLATALVPIGDSLRGTAMSLVVVAAAKDSYRAAFDLAELDESIGAKQAFVCDKQDGQSLSSTDGPLRLMVPSDKRPARWVRMLTSLEIQQTQP